MRARNLAPKVLWSLPLLLAAAPSAYAHGIESVVQALVIAAAIAGGVGGLVTGAIDGHPGIGVGVTTGVSIAACLVYVAAALGPAEFVGALLPALALMAFAGVTPLVIAFFVAFGLAVIVRTRVLKKGKVSNAAP